MRNALSLSYTMEQKYLVFSERKCLVFSSFQHLQDDALVEKTKFNTFEYWEHIHNQPNERIEMPCSFQRFKKDFTFIPAAGGIVKHEKKLLMIFRNGTWDLPKGWMDAGEFPMQTALREVREECGPLDLIVVDNLPITTYHWYPVKGKFLLKETQWFFMSAAHSHPLIPQKKEGITKAAFVGFESVEERLAKSFPMLHYLWERIQLHNTFIS